MLFVFGGTWIIAIGIFTDNSPISTLDDYF